MKCTQFSTRRRIRRAMRYGLHFENFQNTLLGLCLLLGLPLLLLLFKMHGELRDWHAYFGVLTRPGLGEMGNPARVNMSFEELAAFQLKWENGYNGWLAERISVKRKLPDLREKRCLDSNYTELLGEVAIIIVYRNELLAMLMRTLHSIFDRTTRYLILELLIIDEESDMDELSIQAFDGYIKQHFGPTVRIFHLPEPVGLIRARNFAAEEANADILVFVDVHVEVTEGWLEPLLQPISLNRKTVTMPMLDRIDNQNFAYRRSAERRTLFDWSLRQRKVPLSSEQVKDLPSPFETPLIEDAMFAIATSYFDDLQHYDREMRGSEGANLELSFKVWRCGGRVLKVPCSRVGYLYRQETSYKQLYGNMHEMGGERYKNYKRIVETWLDNYKDHVYRYQPQIKAALEGNLAAQFDWRNVSDCKSFDWYLENVAPDLLQYFPDKPRPDFALGSIRPLKYPRLCLTGDLRRRSISLEHCNQLPSQNWTWSYMMDIRLNGDMCLELRYEMPRIGLGLGVCHNLGGPQFWRYNEQTKHLISSYKCLHFNETQPNTPYMDQCNVSNSMQQWVLEVLQKSIMDKRKT